LYKDSQWYQEALAVLADDINTPKLLAVINKALAEPSDEVYSLITFLDEYLLKLGLFEEEKIIKIPAEIEELAQQRIDAKQAKDYALADELRNKITEM
jgi:cysteinyl-tRNA synthetase